MRPRRRQFGPRTADVSVQTVSLSERCPRVSPQPTLRATVLNCWGEPMSDPVTVGPSRGTVTVNYRSEPLSFNCQKSHRSLTSHLVRLIHPEYRAPARSHPLSCPLTDGWFRCHSTPGYHSQRAVKARRGAETESSPPRDSNERQTSGRATSINFSLDSFLTLN